MAAKLKALQQWCKLRCDGYRDVQITNLTSSWKSGLAFCAIIHRYRPDLIDYDSLSKENVFENNKLAFDVASQHLDIPALLDAEDMVAMAVPDKLCIVTYVAQYHNYFRDKEQLGGPGVKSRVSTKRPTPSTPPVSAKRFGSDKSAEKQEPLSGSENRTTFTDKCTLCRERVYVLERHFDGTRLYHRRCFRDAERSSSVRSPSHRTTTATENKTNVNDVERQANVDDVAPRSCDQIKNQPAGQVCSQISHSNGKTFHGGSDAKQPQPRINSWFLQPESGHSTETSAKKSSQNVHSQNVSPSKFLSSVSSSNDEGCKTQSDVSRSTSSPTIISASASPSTKSPVSPSQKHGLQPNNSHKSVSHEKMLVDADNNGSAQNKHVVAGLLQNLQKLRRESAEKSPQTKFSASPLKTDVLSSKQSPLGGDAHKTSRFDYAHKNHQGTERLLSQNNALTGSRAKVTSPTSPARSSRVASEVFKPNTPSVTSPTKSPNVLSPSSVQGSAHETTAPISPSPSRLPLSAPPRPKHPPHSVATSSSSRISSLIGERSDDNEEKSPNEDRSEMRTLSYQGNIAAGTPSTAPRKSILKMHVKKSEGTALNGGDTTDPVAMSKINSSMNAIRTSDAIAATPRHTPIPKWDFSKKAKDKEESSIKANRSVVSDKVSRGMSQNYQSKISSSSGVSADEQSALKVTNTNGKTGSPQSYSISRVSAANTTGRQRQNASKSTYSSVSNGDENNMLHPKSILKKTPTRDTNSEASFISEHLKDGNQIASKASQAAEKEMKTGELDWQVEARKREKLRAGKYEEPSKKTPIKRAEVFSIKDSLSSQSPISKEALKESKNSKSNQQHSPQMEPLKTIRENCNNNAEHVKSREGEGEQKTEWQIEAERRKRASSYNNGEPISQPRSPIHPADPLPIHNQPVAPPRKHTTKDPPHTVSAHSLNISDTSQTVSDQSRTISEHSKSVSNLPQTISIPPRTISHQTGTASHQLQTVSTTDDKSKTTSSTEVSRRTTEVSHKNEPISPPRHHVSHAAQSSPIDTLPVAPPRKRLAATCRISFNAHDFHSAVDGSETNQSALPTIPPRPTPSNFVLKADKAPRPHEFDNSTSGYNSNTYSLPRYNSNMYSPTGGNNSMYSPDANKANTYSPDGHRAAMQIPKRRVNAEERMSIMQISTSLYHLDMQLRDLEDYGRELEEKIRGQSDDAMDANDDFMVQWFGLVNQKNELVRKEADLMYRKKQQELEDIHEDLEFEYRCLMEKPDHLKTSSERIRERTLLDELLDTVSQRNSIVDSIEDDRIRYIKEDEEIANVLADQAFNTSNKKKKKNKKNKKKDKNGKKST